MKTKNEKIRKTYRIEYNKQKVNMHRSVQEKRNSQNLEIKRKIKARYKLELKFWATRVRYASGF